MKYFIAVLLLVLVPAVALSQTEAPRVGDIDFSVWGQVYLPSIKRVDSRTELEELSAGGRVVTDTNSSKEIHIISESDLVETPYDESYLRAVIFDDGVPLAVVEINKYRNYEFSWVGPDVLNIFSSPGRCIRIDTQFNVSTMEVVEQKGTNFC